MSSQHIWLRLQCGKSYNGFRSALKPVVAEKWSYLSHDCNTLWCVDPSGQTSVARMGSAFVADASISVTTCRLLLCWPLESSPWYFWNLSTATLPRCVWSVLELRSGSRCGGELWWSMCALLCSCPMLIPKARPSATNRRRWVLATLPRAQRQQRFSGPSTCMSAIVATFCYCVPAWRQAARHFVCYGTPAPTSRSGLVAGPTVLQRYQETDIHQVLRSKDLTLY